MYIGNGIGQFVFYNGTIAVDVMRITDSCSYFQIITNNSNWIK